MLSIPSTLSLHRATRSLYMDAARRARATSHNFAMRATTFGSGFIPVLAPVYGSKKFVWIRKVPSARDAMRCFLRRARQANWRLVAVKRFAREFEVGRGNLLKLGDDSAWGDI